MTLRDVADRNKLRLHFDGVIKLLDGKVEIYEWGDDYFCVNLTNAHNFIHLRNYIRKLGGVVCQEGDEEVVLKIHQKVLDSIISEIRKT